MGGFSPDDRRVADLACSELRLHTENGGLVAAPLEHSGEIVTLTSQGEVRLRPLDLGLPDRWAIQYTSPQALSDVGDEAKRVTEKLSIG